MEQLIPLFACRALGPALEFYEALGFGVGYRQERPYLYAAASLGAVTLHFSKRPGPGTCLAFAPAIAERHRAFADGLRARYGAVPTAGQPRLSRLRPGQTRFHLFDPAGNLLLWIDQAEPERDSGGAAPTPLAQALENAAFLRDTYADDRAAARVLDKALARAGAADPLELALALAARAELAVALGDAQAAADARAARDAVELPTEVRERRAPDLLAAERLARWIVSPD